MTRRHHNAKSSLCLSPEAQEQLNSIVAALQQAQGVSMEALIILLLRRVLHALAPGGQEICSLAELSPAKRAALQKQLEQIIMTFSQQGLPQASLLVMFLLKRLLGAHERKKGEEHEEEDGLGPRARKELREILDRAAQYERYKIDNPNQIAGETKAQNFMNNLVRYGREVAEQFPGGLGRPQQNSYSQQVRWMQQQTGVGQGRGM